MEEASDGGKESDILPTSVLKRVATVASKEDCLQPEVIKEIHNQHRTWKERQLLYKRPSVRDPGYRDVMKQVVQASATRSRLKIHALKRGHIGGVNIGNEEGCEVKETQQCNYTKTSEGGETSREDDKSGEGTLRVDETCIIEQEDIKYRHVELPWTPDKDNITCNDVVLPKEKYVYDIYPCLAPIDWSEFVCEVEKFHFLTCPSDEELFDDEDDENDESNWRNDYPEEEDTAFEDEEDSENEYEGGYEEEEHTHHRVGRRYMRHDTDESSCDAEEYSEGNGRDEDGKLLQYDDTLHPFRRLLARLAVDDDDDNEETESKRRDSNSESDSGVEMDY